MSARSSSGSWSGAGRSPPDIIDLDKFMRGAVRPVRDGNSLRCGNNLVVDAGGVDRTPGAAAAVSPPAHSAPLPAPPAPALTAPSDSSGSRPRPHGKRFSHDSGLSDTSYARRKHRPHRRAVGDSSGPRAPRSAAGVAGGARGGGGGAGSSSSLRAFRAVCERALLDQQAQIARVAQLCERLSERAPAPRAPPPRRSERSATDSSDVSSSSRSTRDQRRKDKHRTDECKTYKIIMNKLDELNRLFAARARSPPPAARAARLAPAPAPASSGSVSVSDKLVSTEPEPPRGLTRDLQVLHNVVTIRGGSAYGACAGAAARHATRVPARTRALGVALDVAPSDALPLHIATESVAACESRAATGTSGGDPRCGFDLDDPVHIQLYSQAKRLQAMSATTRRARSMEPTARRYERSGRYEQDERRSPGAKPRAREAACEQPREHSLCSLCRGYWRTVTHYIAAQFFCCPDDANAGGDVASHNTTPRRQRGDSRGAGREEATRLSRPAPAPVRTETPSKPPVTTFPSRPRQRAEPWWGRSPAAARSRAARRAAPAAASPATGDGIRNCTDNTKGSNRKGHYVVRVGSVSVVVGAVSGPERARRARLQEEDHLPPAARRQARLRRRQVTAPHSSHTFYKTEGVRAVLDTYLRPIVL